jgi:hypothetical protein
VRFRAGENVEPQGQGETYQEGITSEAPYVRELVDPLSKPRQHCLSQGIAAPVLVALLAEVEEKPV